MDYIYFIFQSLVDEEGLAAINSSAMMTMAEYNAGHYSNATNMWIHTTSVVEAQTGGVSFYNILKFHDNEKDNLAKKQSSSQQHKPIHLGKSGYLLK